MMNTEKQEDSFGETRGQKQKKFKFPLWTIISSFIIALLVGVAFLIPQFLDQSRYKPQIQEQILKATGYEVNWEGDVTLRLLPLPTASAKNIEVKANGQQFAKLQEATVRVALAPLFEKRVEVTGVNLEAPIVTLITDKNGNNLWEVKKAQSEITAQQHHNSSKNAGFHIGKIRIENGNVKIQNLQKNSVEDIKDINLTLDIGDLQGALKAAGSLTARALPLELDVELAKLPKAGEPQKLKGIIKVKGADLSLNFDQTLNMNESLTASGTLSANTKNLKNTLQTLTGKAPELPPALLGNFTFNAETNYNSNSFAAKNMKAQLGSISLSGFVAAENLNTSPNFKVNIISKNSGKVADDMLIKILSDLALSSQFSLDNNKLTLANTSLTLDGQKIDLSGQILLPKSKEKPNLNLNVRASTLDLDDLQKQFAEPATSAAQKEENQSTKTDFSKFGFTLPFTGNVQAAIGALRTGGKDFSNIALNVTASEKGVTIQNLALTAAAETTLHLKGQIGDTQNLSGLNLSVNAKTQNLENFANAFSIQLPKMQKPLGATALNGNFSGSLAALNFNATTSVWGFDITGKGQVAELNSQTPRINALDARINHKNTSEAASVFAKGFEPPKSFKGAIDIGATLNWDKNQYRISNFNGRIGSTSVNGSLNFVQDKIPTLSGALILGAVELESHAPKAGGGGTSASTAQTAQPRWSREAINTDWMRSFNADLGIEAQSLTQGLWRFENPKFSFQLSNGTLDIKNLSAGLFGGNATLNGTIKSAGTSNAPLSLNGTLSAKNISAQKLHSAVSNTPQNIFQGNLDSFNISLDALGLSPAALIQSLSGKGALSGSNIIVKGVDAVKLAEAARGSFKPIGRAGTLFQSFQTGQTQFNSLNTSFDIQSGVVNFSQIKLDGTTATIYSAGNLNLPRWTIDLNNKMTIKNTDIPAFDFKISGPLDSPLQTGGSIIENYLKQRATAKIEKEAVKLLDKHLGGELGSAVGGLLGIKKPAEEQAPTPETQPATEPQQISPTPTPEAAPAAAEPAPAETPQDALGNILADPKNIKPDDAVKALEGLFGQ